MNNYFTKYYVLLLLLMTLWAPQCFAFGMGFTFGAGSEDWEDDNTGADYGERDVSNFGFVMDTTVARDKLFNYRFSLMREEITSDNNGEIELDGTSMTHDFGFAVLRSKRIRLWLGPRVRVGRYDGEQRIGTARYKDDFVGFAIGPVIGVNIHLPQVMSISITTAFLLGGYENDDLFDDDYDADGVYVNAAFIFRLGDKY